MSKTTETHECEQCGEKTEIISEKAAYLNFMRIRGRMMTIALAVLSLATVALWRHDGWRASAIASVICVASAVVGWGLGWKEHNGNHLVWNLIQAMPWSISIKVRAPGEDGALLEELMGAQAAMYLRSIVVPGGLEKSLCLAYRTLFQKDVGHAVYAMWAEEMRRRFREGKQVRVSEFLVEMNQKIQVMT